MRNLRKWWYKGRFGLGALAICVAVMTPAPVLAVLLRIPDIAMLDFALMFVPL